MYQGYIACGMDDPFAVPPMESTEIINNSRAYAYAKWAALPWVVPCDECDGVEVITSQGQGFLSPILDPAPWYDVNNPDSWGFLGVLGMEITGGSDSTRQANVSMSLSGIGVIGRTYLGPRTMVVRAICIAKDDCSLEYGLGWLRLACTNTMNPCGGDPVTFFDCCPCICTETEGPEECWADTYFELETFPLCESQPCLPPDCANWVDTYDELITGDGADPLAFPNWPETYEELDTGPADATCWPSQYVQFVSGPPCADGGVGGPDWWPETYQELIDGPPPPFEDLWCDWPDNYFELATGPPPYACCVDACLGPYMRQFHNSRITAGPTVLRRPQMTCGAMVEVEFTIVAGDPEPTGMPFKGGSATLGVSIFDELVSDDPPLTAVLNPFAAVS